MIEVEMCPGLRLPVLTVEQLCACNKEEMFKWLEGTSKSKPRRKRESEADHEDDAPHDPERLFGMMTQSADNLGDTDERRALNFLIARYKPIYEQYALMNADYDLISVLVMPSRLWRERRIVNPVFSYRHRKTGIVRKFFVRVDITYLFPIIVSHLAECYDR